MERSLVRAEEVSHPTSLVHALIYAVVMRESLREPYEAWRLAQRGVSLAREHGFSLDTTQGAVVQCCVMLQRGELQEGLTAIPEALSAYRATGAQLFLPLFLAFLAEGYLQLERISDGLQVVTEALQRPPLISMFSGKRNCIGSKGMLMLAQSRVQKNQNSK